MIRKEIPPGAAILIASPEMCQSEPYALISRVKITGQNQAETAVQLVALNCRKREDIPHKLQSILAEVLPSETTKRFFENGLKHAGSPKSHRHPLLNIVPHSSIAAESVYVDD